MPEGASMKGNIEVNQDAGYVIISINPKVYPLDVVLSSAYAFTEKYYCLVDGDLSEEIIVELRPKDKDEDLEEAGRKFNNELILYASYAVQSLKNQMLREAIIDRVLMTNYVKPEADFDDKCAEHAVEPWKDEVKPWQDEASPEQKPWDDKWFDDPEGIAVPWEEKYGQDAKSEDKQE